MFALPCSLIDKENFGYLLSLTFAALRTDCFFVPCIFIGFSLVVIITLVLTRRSSVEFYSNILRGFSLLDTVGNGFQRIVYILLSKSRECFNDQIVKRKEKYSLKKQKKKQKNLQKNGSDVFSLIFELNLSCGIFIYCDTSVFICSPGVIITEIHKRGGMDDEAYAKVTLPSTKVQTLRIVPGHL